MQNSLVELNVSVPERYKRFPVLFLLEQHNEIYDIIYNKIVVQDDIFNFGLLLKFVIQISKQSPNQDEKVENLFLSTHRYILTYLEIREVLTLIIQWFSNRLELLLLKTQGSGWVIDKVVSFQICYHKVMGINRAGSPLVDYPATRCRNFIFNPPAENLSDKTCIAKCIAAHILKDKYMYKNKKPNWCYIKNLLIRKKNIKRYLNYGKADNISFDNLNVIENANKIKIRVYYLYFSEDTKKHELSLFRKGNKKYVNTCNLILYKYVNNNNNFSWHCFLIKTHINQFLNNFLTFVTSKDERICPWCFTKHANSTRLKKHKHKYCCNKETISDKIYPVNAHLKFKNFQKTQKIDYIVFYDFEAGFHEINTSEKIHIPVIYSYLIIRTKLNEIVDFHTELNLNPELLVNSFLERIKNFWVTTCPYYQSSYLIHFSPSQLERHNSKTHCEICTMEFTEENYKCAHHDHTLYCNNYISALCLRCNLKITRQKKLFLISHNSSYDMNFLIKYSSNDYDWKILTQKSRLKFYNISARDLYFIDSYQFLKSSLSKLISQAKEDKKLFPFFNKIICEKFQINVDDELFSLLKGKLHFPYDFINHMDKLDQVSFPAKDKFYDSLNKTCISQKDYNNALKIYNLTECENLGQYYSLYCEIDVIMLADIYLMHREFMYKEFKLDICQYLTLPSFSMDSFLYFKLLENPYFKIDLMNDIDLINFIQNSIRGGFTQLNQHSLTLNDASKLLLNENLSKRTYKSGILVSCIDTYDLNSNYASSMCEPLPIGNFNKITDENEIESIIHSLKNNKINFKNSNIGYYLHVSLDKNSIEVQNQTDEFPFALEKKDILFKQLSSYTQNNFTNKFEKEYKFKRLIGHHFEKNSYFVEAESLQQYLYYGLKLNQVFDVYSYNQEPFLKDFIIKNIHLRKQTKSKMDSDLFKLCNNSIFGKTLTNVTNYSTYTVLCLNKKSFFRHISSPYFIDYTIIHENKIMVTMRKRKITFNYPTYIGFSILEKSQRYMKHIYYDIIKVVLQNNFLTLLYSDTDSFYIHYKILLKEYSQEAYFSEKYKIIKKFKEKCILDTSNFHPSSELYDITNKGELFYMKMENSKIIYGGFYGLAPKVYIFETIPYHVQKIISEIRLKFLKEIGNEISILYLQNTCSIFEINSNNLKIFEIFKTFLNKKSIMLEGWYLNKLEFCNFIETYDSLNLENETSISPKCQDFYKKEILNLVNEKKTSSNIFYFEIDTNYNAKFFKYANNFNIRPEMNDNIKSDYELLMSSSKACAGISFSIMKNISLQDYKNALLDINNIKKINYNIITNDKYVNKTISVSKKALKSCCVKKYMKNEHESYSFGFHKIPIEVRYNFISDNTLSSNSDNTLENIQEMSNTSSNIGSSLSGFSFSNNSSDISLPSEENCLDIFKNRKTKILKQNIFPNNNLILNNTSSLNFYSSSEDFFHENDPSQPSTSKVKEYKKKNTKKKSNFILYEADASSLSSSNEENININYYDLNDGFINDEISESGTSSNFLEIEENEISESDFRINFPEIDENNITSHSDTNSETKFFQNVKKKQVFNYFSDENS